MKTILLLLAIATLIVTGVTGCKTDDRSNSMYPDNGKPSSPGSMNQ